MNVWVVTGSTSKKERNKIPLKRRLGAREAWVPQKKTLSSSWVPACSKLQQMSAV